MVVELEMKKSDSDCGEERLTEGWINKTAPDEPGDRISAPKSGSRAHTSRRVELRSSEKSGVWRHVDDYFPTGFPLTYRSASCASKFEVSGRRRASRKKSPAGRRSDSGGGGQRRRRRGSERKIK